MPYSRRGVAAGLAAVALAGCLDAPGDPEADDARSVDADEIDPEADDDQDDVGDDEDDPDQDV